MILGFLILLSVAIGILSVYTEVLDILNCTCDSRVDLYHLTWLVWLVCPSTAGICIFITTGLPTWRCLFNQWCARLESMTFKGSTLFHPVYNLTVQLLLVPSYLSLCICRLLLQFCLASAAYCVKSRDYQLSDRGSVSVIFQVKLSNNFLCHFWK